jgi:hypothetical protein
MKKSGSSFLCLAGLAAWTAFAQKPEDMTRVAGDWRGDSICALATSGCHNEKVIWHIAAVPNKPGLATVRGDRIDSGKTVDMGTLEFHYDADSQALICEGSFGTWRFTVDGRKLEATLTRPDKIVFRRVVLRKPD